MSASQLSTAARKQKRRELMSVLHSIQATSDHRRLNLFSDPPERGLDRGEVRGGGGAPPSLGIEVRAAGPPGRGAGETRLSPG